jgi:hypothetical protein
MIFGGLGSLAPLQPDQGHSFPVVFLPLALLVIVDYLAYEVSLQQLEEPFICLDELSILSRYEEPCETDLSSFLPAEEDLDVLVYGSQIAQRFDQQRKCRLQMQATVNILCTRCGRR